MWTWILLDELALCWIVIQLDLFYLSLLDLVAIFLDFGEKIKFLHGIEYAKEHFTTSCKLSQIGH